MSKMTDKSGHKILIGLATIALLMVSSTTCQNHKGPPEGTWTCKSKWSKERNGVTVPRSVEQECTCKDNVLSIRGVVSIGSAQWLEKKEGTCYASGDELHGTWTSVQTFPKNEAARQFEQERLEGKSLAIASKAIEEEHRVRVTSRTDTQIKAVDGNGRVISCTRL